MVAQSSCLKKYVKRKPQLCFSVSFHVWFAFPSKQPRRFPVSVEMGRAGRKLLESLLEIVPCSRLKSRCFQPWVYLDVLLLRGVERAG